ncbi:MAG TPA: hypothetical protein VEF34_10310 [Syntrophobacteraceae bacterium]|nr:hypothetical protein [Syntrophobacteraceae bacterium]
MNLFEVARANGPRLEERGAEILSSLHPESRRKIEEFRIWIFEEARVSINLPPAVLAELTSGETYRNIYESAAEQAVLSGRQKDEILRERLGKYYNRRIAFDMAFSNSEKFRYGVLNAGGAGLTAKFGVFCAVLNKDFLEPSEDMAYLPNDSLVCCFDELGVFDKNRAKRLAASNSHRHWLATIKHAVAVQGIPKELWVQDIVKDDDYIEAIFTSPVSLESLGEVRILKTRYDELWHMAFDDLARKRSDAEKALMKAFARILKAVREGRISLEVLP